LSKFKIPFFIIFKPYETWKYVLKKDINLRFTVFYMFALASIGPILSFFNISFIEKLSTSKALTYSLVTYILDVSFSFLFAFILKFLLKVDFEKALKISVFSQTAIWLSDIVDISQYLRPLSNIGLALSLYSLFFVLKNIFKINYKRLFIIIALFLILYILNALISELIVLNPYLKALLNRL